jgi:hypothetical protein
LPEQLVPLVAPEHPEQPELRDLPVESGGQAAVDRPVRSVNRVPRVQRVLQVLPVPQDLPVRLDQLETRGLLEARDLSDFLGILDPVVNRVTPDSRDSPELREQQEL